MDTENKNRRDKIISAAILVVIWSLIGLVLGIGSAKAAVVIGDWETVLGSRTGAGMQSPIWKYAADGTNNVTLGAGTYTLRVYCSSGSLRLLMGTANNNNDIMYSDYKSCAAGYVEQQFTLAASTSVHHADSYSATTVTLPYSRIDTGTYIAQGGIADSGGFVGKTYDVTVSHTPTAVQALTNVSVGGTFEVTGTSVSEVEVRLDGSTLKKCTYALPAGAVEGSCWAGPMTLPVGSHTTLYRLHHEDGWNEYSETFSVGQYTFGQTLPASMTIGDYVSPYNYWHVSSVAVSETATAPVPAAVSSCEANASLITHPLCWLWQLITPVFIPSAAGVDFVQGQAHKLFTERWPFSYPYQLIDALSVRTDSPCDVLPVVWDVGGDDIEIYDMCDSFLVPSDPYVMQMDTFASRLIYMAVTALLLWFMERFI